VDVGGGLGVDYEGTRSRSFCSMNYSVEEYARNMVYAPGAGLPRARAARTMPEIFTESGRAMTAHHAVLITNVIDCEPPPGQCDPAPRQPGEPAVLSDMWRALLDDDRRPASEIYHDASYGLSNHRPGLSRGLLSLADRARAEELYFADLPRLLTAAETLPPGRDSYELVDKLADKYFCNFSVFQSIPDAWAIDQIFPVMPLHRLDEAPVRRAVLQDLTCDSDGHVDGYVDGREHQQHAATASAGAGEDYCSVSSWWVPTRRSSAICTTCSATRIRSTWS
jgi:arginine decarboxylase